MTGNATFTTVPSMKAMLDPSIVVARTHAPPARDAAGVDGPRRTPSPAGGLVLSMGFLAS
jgi:hypothetical protein